MKQQNPGLQKQFLLFTSENQLGVINADGSQETYLDFQIPNQERYQFGSIFPDKRYIILNSYEEGKYIYEDGALKEITIKTHCWKYDLITGEKEELLTRERKSHWMGIAGILPDNEYCVASALIDKRELVFYMKLDGSEAKPVTTEEDGYAYGLSLNPARDRLAFHITYPYYRIWTLDPDGSNRVTVADHPDHLYFAPTWSPDGEWLAYVDCLYKDDPGHDGADLCIGKPDGSDHRVITEGQRHWFGTSFGNPESRGGGSNMTSWSPDGKTLTYTRRLPGSLTAWQWATDRPDNDHYNRDYKPELARGGSELCLVNPFSREITQLTGEGERVWDFRAAWSPDGKYIAFTRARIGEPGEIWIMNADGSNQRKLSAGVEGKGADFPRWFNLQM